MDPNKDWKKAMKEAGFKYMDFVKSAREGAYRDPEKGWAYRVVTVDLEIKLPNGFFSRETVRVEMDTLETSAEPDIMLCREVDKYIKKALKLAGIKENLP